MNVTFKVYRYEPGAGKAPYYQDYTVEIAKGETVLEALVKIKDFQDGTLTFRRSCRSGICGSCAMKINGLNRLACETQVLELKKPVIVVEPLPGFKPIKDLAVALEPFYEAMNRVIPYLINAEPPPTDKERIQSPEDFHKIEISTSCILCAACTSSCPSFWADKGYLGPSAILKAYRYEYDTRDDGFSQRLAAIDNKHGLWRCHTIMNCNDACPKHIFPTEAISLLKRKVVEEKF